MLFKENKKQIKRMLDILFVGFYFSINSKTITIKKNWWSLKKETYDVDFVIRNILIPAMSECYEDNRETYSNLVETLESSSIYETIELLHSKLLSDIIPSSTRPEKSKNTIKEFTLSLDTPLFEFKWPKIRRKQKPEKGKAILTTFAELNNKSIKSNNKMLEEIHRQLDDFKTVEAVDFRTTRIEDLVS